jgi:hypothetical protein
MRDIDRSRRAPHRAARLARRGIIDETGGSRSGRIAEPDAGRPAERNPRPAGRSARPGKPREIMSKHPDHFNYVTHMGSVFGPIKVGPKGLDFMPFLGLVTPTSGSPPLEEELAIDFEALFESLLIANRTTTARLVRFMENRTMATFQDVMDKAFGKDLSESTIRSYVSRATQDLRELESRLWFSTKETHVIRHIDPA